LIRFLVSLKPVNAARNTQSAKSFAPGNRIGLVAGDGGESIRLPGAFADDTVDVFLDIDERLFHGLEKNTRD
jgi:hypothetical protein